MNEKRGLLLPPGGLHISDQLAQVKGADFQVLYADPPWKFRANSGGVGSTTMGRNAGFHYDLMSLADIAAMPVRDVSAKQAVLFLWITGPFLAIGAHLAIMKAWGFKPKAMGFTWIKLRAKAPGMFLDPKLDLHVGLGLTTRKNAEFCLIGTRGKSLRQSRKVHEVGLFPVMEHSRKPVEFRHRIEEYVGPGLQMAELFAREQSPGWSAFGNEVGKFG